MQQETLGHRRRKGDPLYRIRRLPLVAHERLSERGRARLQADYDEFSVPVAKGPTSLFDEVAGPDAGAAPRFGYRGETVLDGMVHLRAREYAAGLGRFTTTDPPDGVAGEVTVAGPYHYADKDPLDKVDPLGLRPISDAELAIKIGFAGSIFSTDPWLAVRFGRASWEQASSSGLGA